MPTQVLDLAMEGILLGASSNSIALKKKRGRGGEPKTNNSGPRSQYFVKRYLGGRSLLSLRCWTLVFSGSMVAFSWISLSVMSVHLNLQRALLFGGFWKSFIFQRDPDRESWPRRDIWVGDLCSLWDSNLSGVLLGGFIGYVFAKWSFSWIFIRLWEQCVGFTNVWKCQVNPVEKNILFKRTNHISRENFMIWNDGWVDQQMFYFVLCPLHRIWSRQDFLGKSLKLKLQFPICRNFNLTAYF